MGNCLILSSSRSLSSSSSSSVSSSRSHSLCSASSYESLADSSGLASAALRKILRFPTVSDLDAHYQLETVLGRGQYGVIRLCTCRASGTRFACKSISKLCIQHLQDILREVCIMQRLSLASATHPNDIVCLHQVIEDASHVHLIMELCHGGELFDSIVKKRCYPEHQAAYMMKSLMQSIQFCHQMGIMHRDIKPENILLVDDSNSSPIKLADFGLALQFSPGEKFSGMAGSAYYIAPEVLQGEYSEEIDVWSAGVVLYVMLSGVPPFWGETEQDIFEAIQKGNLEFDRDPWKSISFPVKDLIRQMLCADIKRRLTPAQVLEHPWICHHTNEPKEASQHQCEKIMSISNAPALNAHATDAQSVLAPSSTSPTPLFNDNEQQTAKKVLVVRTPSSTSPVVLSEDNEQKSASPTLTSSNVSNGTLQESHLDNYVKTNMDALVVALVAKFDIKCPPMPESLAKPNVQGGQSCALISVSPAEKIFSLEVGKKRYLISYKSTRRESWKILGQHHKQFYPCLHANTQPQPIVF